MKGDIGFDECQMFTAGNRSHFTRAGGCIKARRGSGFSRSSFRELGVQFICVVSWTGQVTDGCSDRTIRRCG